MILAQAAATATSTFWADLVDAFHLELLAKLLLAVLLGGAIGLEREISGKAAGLRTNILICVGSALVMDLSLKVAMYGIQQSGGHVGDPARLAAQVVSGIGFLGAGTIIQARGTVVGLTTAATLWVVMAIGLAVGSGAYYEACGATLLVFLVLSVMGSVEHRLVRARRVVSGTVRAAPGTSFEDLETQLRTGGIVVKSKKVFDHSEDRTFELTMVGPARQYDQAAAALMRRTDVISVKFSNE